MNKDNINLFSLAILENKDLYNKEIDKVILFMLSNFKDPKELLSKLKVLQIKKRQHIEREKRNDIFKEEKLYKKIFYKIAKIKGIKRNSDVFDDALLFLEEESYLLKKTVFYYFRGVELNNRTFEDLFRRVVDRILEIKNINHENECVCEEDCKCDNSKEVLSSNESENQNESELITPQIQLLNNNFSAEIKDQLNGEVLIDIDTIDDKHTAMLDKSIANIFASKKDSNFKEHTVSKLFNFLEVLFKKNEIPIFKPFFKLLDVQHQEAKKLVSLFFKNFKPKNIKTLVNEYFNLINKNGNNLFINSYIVRICKKLNFEFDWNILLEIVSKKRRMNPSLIDHCEVPTDMLFKYLENAKGIFRYFELLKRVIKRENNLENLEYLRSILNNKKEKAKKIIDCLENRIKMLNK